MIIDCHGHYTTAPRALEIFRERQLASPGEPIPLPSIEDEEIRRSVESAQLKLQKERGTDRTIFSPRA